ncbi:MAG: hypothetical protein ABIJ86_01615, partial [Spirochaetota bacterium]
SLKLDGVFNRDEWQALIDSLAGAGVLRAKGIIRFPAGLRYFELISGEYSEKEVPLSLAGRQQSIFTFVARDKFSTAFTDQIKACAGGMVLKSQIPKEKMDKESRYLSSIYAFLSMDAREVSNGSAYPSRESLYDR